MSSTFYIYFLLFWNNRKDLNSVKPLALVKLYFKQRYAESTNVDVVGDWVNLLSECNNIYICMDIHSSFTYFRSFWWHSIAFLRL